MKGGLPDHDLKALGEVLEQGQAGLLVINAATWPARWRRTSRRSRSTSRTEIDAQADALARQAQGGRGDQLSATSLSHSGPDLSQTEDLNSGTADKYSNLSALHRPH
jgi:hypothetical protein